MRLWPWSKFRKMEEEQRDVLQSLTEDLEESRKDLRTEHTKYISAIAIAEERKSQLAKAYESLAKAEAVRDEAVTGRLKSLDLVNSTLLQAYGPEKAPTNLKELTKEVTEMPQRRNGVAAARMSDIQFVQDYIRKNQKSKQAANGTVVDDSFIPGSE